MKTKQSRAALIRLLETAIRDVGDIDSQKLYVLVRDVEASGSPPTRIVASLLVRFVPSGAPFCCGEPACYLRVFREDGAEELGDYVRRKMNLRHQVTVELEVSVEYFDGIEFAAHQ